MSRYYCLFLVVASLFCGLLAPNEAGAGGSTNYAPITKIYMFSNGGFFVYTDGDWPNPDGCAHPFRIYLDTTHMNYDKLSVMIYDAYANGDLVDFNLNGCIQAGQYQNPKITAVLFAKEME